MKKFFFSTILCACTFGAIAQPHTFTNSGTNVGIGTTSPGFSARLHVQATPVPVGDGERLFYGTVLDAPNEFIAITNGASQDSIFNPVIYGAKHNNKSGPALLLMGSIASGVDVQANATSPVMVFNVRRDYLPNASGSSTAVQNRPIFQWSNLGTARMTMSANGNLGIGTTTPSAILHTNGNVRLQGLPTQNHTSVVAIDNNGNLAIRPYPTPSPSLTLNCANTNYLSKVTGTNTMSCSQVFDNGTFIGIGTTTASSGIRLNVNGNIQALGITTLSDERYKTQISPLIGALAIVLNLKPITYQWDNRNDDGLHFDNNQHLGLTAQDLEKVIPEVVRTSEDGMKSVNYTELIPVLINAIQEQQKEIEVLKEHLLNKK